MKSLIFDSSTIITLSLNNMLWILEPLKKKFNGEFFIPSSVKNEIIDVPLKSKRFKLEALQVSNFVNRGILKIYDDSKYSEEIKRLTQMANSIYTSDGRYVTLLHGGEMGALVLAKNLNSEGLVIDERTARMFLEYPEQMGIMLKNKLHRDVRFDKENIKKFAEEFKKVKVIRSTELGVIAFELGILDEYIRGGKGREMKRELLDGFLWGMKLKGCAISVEEINSALKYEGL